MDLVDETPQRGPVARIRVVATDDGDLEHIEESPESVAPSTSGGEHTDPALAVLLQGVKILSSGMKELKASVDDLHNQVSRLHERLDHLEMPTSQTSNPGLDELTRVIQELLGTQSKISAQLTQARDGRVGINVPTLTMSSIMVPDRRKGVTTLTGPSAKDVPDAAPGPSKFPAL